MTSLLQTSYPTFRQHVTTHPWTPLSSSAAPSGLPASLAPFSAPSAVSLSRNASMISGARRARMAKQRLARPPEAITPAASPAAGSATAAAALPAASAILSNFGQALPALPARPLHISRYPLPSRLRPTFLSIFGCAPRNGGRAEWPALDSERDYFLLLKEALSAIDGQNIRQSNHYVAGMIKFLFSSNSQVRPVFSKS